VTAVAALALLLGGAAAPPAFSAPAAAPAKASPQARAAAPPSAPAPAAIDANSAPLVDALLAALGGIPAWNGLPAIRFDFVVQQKGKDVMRRRHWWDKARSRCRVEWTDSDGRVVAADVNLMTRKGRSCTAGVADTDTLLAKHVEDAYAMWVNDSYWLAMPFKLHDPGVRIEYDRRVKRPEGEYDVLALSFAGVGLTPQDHYWLYLNRATHRLDRWEYLLQGHKPPPQAAQWSDWQPVGPVRVPMVRLFDGKAVNLRFENVAAPPSFDERLLTDPCARG
jgi:hypothetical protein